MIYFGGFKAIGVNKTTKNPVEAMKFAQFITNYENQMMRYEVRGFAPTNIQAAANEKILSDKAIAALSLQMQYSYPQTNVISTFWTPAEALGTEMEKKTILTLEDLIEQVELMIATITG
jgi:arabinogalactan oligomer/maltooligosaccharide transport system substrate-binding protein